MENARLKIENAQLKIMVVYSVCDQTH